jgi:hypothetical protein
MTKNKTITVTVTYIGYDGDKEDAIHKAFGRYHYGAGTFIATGERDHSGGVPSKQLDRVVAKLKAIRGVVVEVAS